MPSKPTTWKYRARRRLKFGTRNLHVFVNVTQSGFSSWGFKLGPYSKNVTRRTESIDTPGPGGLKRSWRTR